MDPQMTPTADGIRRLYAGVAPLVFQPLVEVRDIRILQENRYRITIADGEFTTKALMMPRTDGPIQLWTQLSEGKINIHSLLRLTEYRVEEVQGKTYFFILEGEHLGLIPEGQRTPSERLRIFKSTRTMGIADTQAAPSQIDAQAQVANAADKNALTTPEKRGGNKIPDNQLMTPPPVSAPSYGAVPAFNSASAQKPSAPTPVDIGEAPTQPNADLSLRGVPATNPYAVAYGGGHPSINAQPLPQQQAPATVSSATSMNVGQTSSSTGQRGLGQFFGSSSSSTGAAPAAAAKPKNAQPFTPIAALSPYMGGRWRVKARVVTKGEVRKFSNARGEGQLLKVDLADASGEISATFFGRAVDMFGPILRQGQVYSFSKGQIKPANRRFDRGDHVLTFEERSLIESEEEDQGIPGVTYEIKPLADMQEVEANTLVDAAGVITHVGEPNTFVARTSGKEMTKRELSLWDGSGADGNGMVELVFWGDRALDNSFEVGGILFAKSARINEFNGTKSLSSPAGVELNPDQSLSFTLRAKFEEYKKTNPLPQGPMRPAGMPQGAGRTFHTKTLLACREEDMNLGPPLAPGQPLDRNGPMSVHQHFSQATVLQMMNGDRLPAYPSCPSLVDNFRAGATQGAESKRACNKKMNQEGAGADGVWVCGNGHSHHQPVWRYLCRLSITDHSDSLEADAFDEVSQRIFGVDAGEYKRMFEDPNEAERLQEINDKVLFQRFAFRMRAKKEIWQETERVRYSVEHVAPINLAQDARQMLADVNASLAQTGFGA